MVSESWRDGLVTKRAASVGRLASGLGCAGLAAFVASAPQALATENALNFYLLGSGGPGAAIMPPLKGVYFDNMTYVYDGSASASKQFELGGIVVAGVSAIYPLNFTTVAWVPTTNLLGGTLSVGGAVPIGFPHVEVDAVISGPLGQTFPLSRSDSAVLIGDPIATAALGWKWGDYHLQVAELFNIPVGEYRFRRLANIALHRFAADTSVAFTWHDDKSRWDVSAKAGVTANGENPDTQYITGTESHFELAVEKILSKAFAVGLDSYHFDQLTGDTGFGDRIGPFEGQVTGFGGTAEWNFKLGQKPANLRLRVFHEFDAVNRLQGTAELLELSFPLKMKLPPAPPAHP